MFNFKKITIYFSVLLISLTFSSWVFANDDVNIVQSKIIEDENAVVLSLNEPLITPMSSFKPSQLKTDWGGLISRSTFSNQSGSTKIYHNSGNYNKAMTEFNKLGGRGEVVQHVTKNGTTFVKTTTDGGTVTLYRSTSATLGEQRPTLSFLNDKIRFLGN